MNGRRLAIFGLLFLGLLLVVAAVYFVFFNDSISFNTGDNQPTATPQLDIDFEPDTDVVATVAPEETLVEVVVSLQTVPRGFRMTEAELTTELRLASDVSLNVITDINDALGKFARTDIYQGETLTKDALVIDPTYDGQNEYGPTSLVPPGFIAMAVPIDRLGSVGYSVAPGDFVDVLISFLLIEVDEQFQSPLPNAASLIVDSDPSTLITGEELVSEEDIENFLNGEGTLPSVYLLERYGRFEELPDGSFAHISPSEEEQRALHISFLIQNAKVIQVGGFEPRGPAQPPTPTPPPDVTPEAQGGPPPPPPTPAPDVVLLALPPQEQIFLKYAVETNAILDLALRGLNDGALYPVENITFDYILERFNVEIPPNFTYVVNSDPNRFVKVVGDSEDIGGGDPELIVTVVATPEVIGGSDEDEEEQP